MKRDRRHRDAVKPQSGFSLIELMISMVIGLVVVGAVFSAYIGSGNSSRATRALAQMTEDVQVAFGVMRANVTMAGYAIPSGIDAANGRFYKTNIGWPLKACVGAFTNPSAELEFLNCSGSGSDSIAVSFEADGSTLPLAADGKPLDCLGNGIVPVAGKYIADSRFYLAKPAGAALNALYCKGANPGDGAQAIVDNIDSMRIEYGVPGPLDLTSVAYYTRAPLSSSEYSDLLTVRICVVVVSTAEVLDSIASYRDCSGATVTPPDRRLYRAFTTTIALNNRISPVPGV